MTMNAHPPRQPCRRITLLFICTLLAIGETQAAPLPSWNETAAKSAIFEFVEKTTRKSSADYVPERERIAVFDNDGTLWPEQPIYFQFAFAIDRVRTLAAMHPDWKTTQPFEAAIENDLDSLASTGEHGLAEILAVSHAGMTTEEFGSIVGAWLTTAKHPKLARRYTELTYQPMRELLDYLRENHFKTFIVSGGGVEFMRAFAEQIYGIPPEQVIGSSGVTTYRDEPPALIKESKVEFIDDGPGKPSGIHRFIGRRPIFAFGNSDGDLQMLQWTAAGSGPRFVALLHHTDAEREFAYDRMSQVGRLDKALDEARSRDWIIVDMKEDWSTVFSKDDTSSPDR